jgi:formiminotetrahydrofolate cyclodeaminase
LKESERLRKQLTELIDKDTDAFNMVMKAFKMPKETEKQKEERGQAIQKTFKTAASVPLETARTCEKILDVALVVAKKGNKSSISDAAVSALMAKAGVQSAVLNVKINLGSIKDDSFIKKISKELEYLFENAEKKTREVIEIVEKNL